ncbi:hypothetical protein [Algisphaera agarilytica]|uniref:Uncharacterized protein n=1 Tax=Algisphaera agarilytica TaxID=1385975 RepID=A0A7X0H7T1_9BACT|nr:hypothetical protein [Algisphaera agarilytica]MBB6430849.1 hypothetical protein [Algisphaera agarilytica]
MSAINELATGTKINVKIVKQPTSAAASKTLVRLLSKDPAVIAENKRHAKIRNKSQWMSTRGGRWRIWESRLAKQHPVKGALGEEGTIVASYDVLKDLPSVERFVEVTAVN